MDALQPEDPRLVGSYRMLHRLGTGGMGRVYLGEAPDGAMVAVKLIRAELADNPDFRRRFAHEVAAAKRVDGMFTARLIDADPDGPQPWLVTAYVAGPSLADAVADSGPLPVETVRILAAGLAEGLGAVHAAGIVHRDLKPSNVLLARDGPRIIDFGISRAADSTWLTSHGGVMGSPGFMSPEQAEGHPVGPPSDIFSLGSVLAFAASGRAPFGSGSPSALLYRVVYSSAALGHVPTDLRPIIESCLAKEPGSRPTTADLLAELGAPEPTHDWLARHAPFIRTAPFVRTAAANGARASSSAGATIVDQTRPSRISRYTRYTHPWHSKAAMAAWALVVAITAGGTSAAVVAGTGLASSPHHHTGRSDETALPPPGPDQRKQIEAMPGPRAVVEEYFDAVNGRDWGRVWQLGGAHLSPSFHAMVTGYVRTVSDEIRIVRVTGDRVIVTLRAAETSGAVQYYRIEYTVRNGVITAGTVLSSSPATAVGHQAQPTPTITPSPAGSEHPASFVAAWPGARGSVKPRTTGNTLVDLDVPSPGSGNDLIGYLGTGGLSIPVADGGGPVP
jgi:Protein kinase domain